MLWNNTSIESRNSKAPRGWLTRVMAFHVPSQSLLPPFTHCQFYFPRSSTSLSCPLALIILRKRRDSVPHKSATPHITSNCLPNACWPTTSDVDVMHVIYYLVFLLVYFMERTWEVDHKQYNGRRDLTQIPPLRVVSRRTNDERSEEFVRLRTRNNEETRCVGKHNRPEFRPYSLISPRFKAEIQLTVRARVGPDVIRIVAHLTLWGSWAHHLDCGLRNLSDFRYDGLERWPIELITPLHEPVIVSVIGESTYN